MNKYIMLDGRHTHWFVLLFPNICRGVLFSPLDSKKWKMNERKRNYFTACNENIVDSCCVISLMLLLLLQSYSLVEYFTLHYIAIKPVHFMHKKCCVATVSSLSYSLYLSQRHRLQPNIITVFIPTHYIRIYTEMFCLDLQLSISWVYLILRTIK